MIVVDASVLTAALIYDDERGARVRRRLAGERLAAPGVIDLEVISSLRGLVRGGRATAQRAHLALTALVALPLDRAAHHRLVRRIWELRDNLSSYDASYVALAERLETPLLTADTGIVRAPGIECQIELLAVE